MPFVGLKSLVFAAFLITFTIIILHTTNSVTKSHKFSLGSRPDYHPPATHSDPPSPKKQPVPYFSELFPVPKPAGLNDQTLSDLPAEEDDVSDINETDRRIYELGRIVDNEAEAASKGDDWMESYEDGVSGAMYNTQEPEEDGDKIWWKHHRKPWLNEGAAKSTDTKDLPEKPIG